MAKIEKLKGSQTGQVLIIMPKLKKDRSSTFGRHQFFRQNKD